MMTLNPKAYLWCFNNTCESACAIAEKLGLKKISHVNSKFKGGPEYTVINWGASTTPESVLKSRIINHPDKVKLAINKLKFFQTVGDKARCVPWTTEPEVAKGWLAEGSKVVCRQRIKGYEGKGIEIVG